VQTRIWEKGRGPEQATLKLEPEARLILRWSMIKTCGQNCAGKPKQCEIIATQGGLNQSSDLQERLPGERQRNAHHCWRIAPLCSHGQITQTAHLAARPPKMSSNANSKGRRNVSSAIETMAFDSRATCIPSVNPLASQVKSSVMRWGRA